MTRMYVLLGVYYLAIHACAGPDLAEAMVVLRYLCFSQVETRTLEEVKEALNYASQTKTSLTRIMLDNMVVPLENGDVDISMLKEAVQLVNGRFETEVCHAN